MTSRGPGKLVATLLVAGIAVGAAPGCGGPYREKPEKLKKMVKKKPPPDAAAAAGPTWDDNCKAAFFEDGTNVRRQSSAARGKITQGDTALNSADASKDPGQQATLAVEAISGYKKALLDDPYSAEATYKLAVAYAKVRKKKCALDLLTRLAGLKKNPDFAADADRMIQAAQQEGAFSGFRKDADSALGI